MSTARAGLLLFWLSLLSLLLELACIRWIPGSVKLMGFYSNLILISAFLGLGIGCLLARSSRDWRPWFAPLVALLVAVCHFSPRLSSARWFAVVAVLSLAVLGVVLVRRAFRARLWATLAVGVALLAAASPLWLAARDSGGVMAWILRGYAMWGGKSISVSWVFVVPLLFVINTAVFVCVGQAIGNALARFAPLRGYSINLLGSLVGVLAFALLSWLGTGPGIWFGIAFVGWLPVLAARPRHLASAALLFAGCLFLLARGQSGAVEIWSPYYKIEMEAQPSGRGPYSLLVNHSFHQAAYDLGPGSAGDPGAAVVRRRFDLPVELLRPERELVLGAGNGNDVAAALRAGVREVHAVEIDPVILDLGRRYHPEDPYHSPRVTVHVDDARAFVRNSRERYDLIAFGTLDSHTLFAGMGNIRLDSYVYTRESIREAWDHLSDRGALAITFSVGRPWIETKLFQILKQASGRPPYVLYPEGEASGTLHKVFLALKDPTKAPPELQSATVLEPHFEDSTVTVPSDDWPHLYIRERSLANEYVSIIVLLSIFSIALTRALVWKAENLDPTFFLLGAGFLLLETKSVTYLALLFGSTWIVNCVVFAAILLTALLSTIAVRALGLRDARPALLGLFLALAAAILLKPEALLLASFPLRLAVAGAFVGVPVLFAGIVFSIRFATAANPAAALGSNLIGAVIGGFLEYASLVTGARAMYALAFALYLAVAWTSRRRPGLSAATPGGVPSP